MVGGFALTPRWQHIDLVVHAQSALVQPQTARVLHDPDAVVTLFLYLVGNLVVTLGRGELVLAHSGIDALRSQLVRLMLAERGIQKTDGQKRLNPYLDTDQQRFLTSLPAAATTSDDILVACQVITVEFVRRARRLAQATGHPFPTHPFPTTLLRATVQHLRRHVGGTWPAPPAMDA